MVSIKAIAMSGNQNLEGFDVTLYNPSEGDTLKAQMIVSHVGDAANWKMCVDASAQSPAQSAANLQVENLWEQDFLSDLCLIWCVNCKDFI